MTRIITGLLAGVLTCTCSLSVFAGEKAEGSSAKVLFEQNCAVCHPHGGNILNPSKTLFEEDLKENNIKTPGDIVKKMRNPGAFSTHPKEWSGMVMFDEKKISDEDALKIADYILKTFK